MPDEKKPDNVQGCAALCIVIAILGGVFLILLGGESHRTHGIILAVGGAVVSAAMFGNKDKK